MRQAIALIAAVPLAYFGYLAAYLTREPAGVPLMVAAAMIAATAVISLFLKSFSLILDYTVYAIVIIVFIMVIYAKIF
ncbi:MAG: hypothetical protein O9330_12330 [Beijerinckiaceae bacterium]|jgi:hypothetical protein|nr:hypothetical protein [Beijerinckiaceae bacterium]